MIHLLFNRAEAKDSIHELNAAEQMKENMKLKDQIMAKDVEISLLKESLIENGIFVYKYNSFCCWLLIFVTPRHRHYCDL